MNLSPNHKGWAWGVDIDGKPVQIPVPFDCHCGTPAVYGDGGKWYCLPCWSKKQPQRVAHFDIPKPLGGGESVSDKPDAP
jgi:hypothetical protein